MDKAIEENENEPGTSATTDWLDWPSLRKPAGKINKTEKGNKWVSANQQMIDGFLIKKPDKPSLFTSISKGLVSGATLKQRFSGPAGSPSISLLRERSNHGNDRQQDSTPAVTGPPVPIGSKMMPQHRKKEETTASRQVSSEAFRNLLTYLHFDVNDYKSAYNKINIGWIKDNDALFGTGLRLIPFIVAVITDEVRRSTISNSSSVKVADRTGGFEVVLHSDIIKAYSSILKIGSAIYVQNVRQQILKRSRVVSVTMKNLVYIATSDAVDPNLIDKPLSVNPFPFYKRLSESVVVVQVNPWKLDQVKAQAEDLINTPTAQASRSANKRPATEMAKESPKSSVTSSHASTVIKSTEPVTVDLTVEDEVENEVTITEAPSTKIANVEINREGNADSTENDEWGDESDFLGLLDQMDKY